jgi:acetyltransferase-like isoleucine patch superfamily enzyme
MKSFFSRYGIIGSLKVLCYLLYTKLCFPRARLIRLPFDVRNKKNINFGKGLTTGVGCRLEAYPADTSRICLTIGNYVEMNDYVHITAMESVNIGNHVLLASKIYISDCSHGSYSGNEFDDSPLIAPNSRKMVSKPVTIEDNVWIGEFVSILPGSYIGKGSIIGTMSVVTGHIPEYSIAVGAPAKVIKKYNFENQKWERVQRN